MLKQRIDTSGYTLDEYKAYRYNEIDTRTAILISAGFPYESNTFSLSVYAQINWTEIHTNQSAFTFPLDISTLDNNEYSLAEANVVAFWTAGKDTLKRHLDTGRILKKQIFDAADRAASEAIVDER